MEIVDKELSLIDSLKYTQAQRPGDMPPFLDVIRNGRSFRYELLFANLYESYKSAQMPNVPHAHPVFHFVLYVRGRGFMRLADQLHPVEGGTLVAIPPGLPHAFTPPGGQVAYHALTFALKDGEKSLELDAGSLLSHYNGKPVVLSALTRPDAATFALLRRRMELLVNALQSQPTDWDTATSTPSPKPTAAPLAIPRQTSAQPRPEPSSPGVRAERGGRPPSRL